MNIKLYTMASYLMDFIKKPTKQNWKSQIPRLCWPKILTSSFQQFNTIEKYIIPLFKLLLSMSKLLTQHSQHLMYIPFVILIKYLLPTPHPINDKVRCRAFVMSFFKLTKRKHKMLFEKLKEIQDANSLHLKVIKSSPRFVQNILPP